MSHKPSASVDVATAQVKLITSFQFIVFQNAAALSQRELVPN
jgi:hypothetical protein